MDRIRNGLVLGVALALTACGYRAPPVTLAELGWGPAPAPLPVGAEMAVVQGDPTSDQPFTLRLRLPDGYRIHPHTHPTDEHVTVLRGTLLFGMGETFEPRTMNVLGADAFTTAPAGHPHYVQAVGETILQVHALGPFSLTYVRPDASPAEGRDH
jgi:quercetin dioxygenase-like cupin family protein